MQRTDTPTNLSDEAVEDGLWPPRLAWRFAGPMAIACTFLALAVWSWRKWPDVLVDFGRELYIPWQLSSGKTLYTDLAYFNGPLSPYLNALWFRMFGSSLSTIILCNLAILAIATILIYRLFADACDRFTATMSCLVLLTVFGFGQLVETGNYNFVTPYSHELTHGLALSIGIILCLLSYARKRRLWTSCLAGLLLGMVFLTKAEIFLAALAAAVSGMAILLVSEPESRQKTMRAVCLAAGSALMPVALFLIVLGQHMTVTESFTRILGTWMSLFGSDVTNNIFYQRNLGLDEPATRLMMTARAFASIVLLVLAAIVADGLSQLRPRAKTIATAVSLTLFVLSCVAKQTSDPFLGSIWLPVPWLMLGASLPFVSFLACVVSLSIAIRGKRARIRAILPFAMWSCFAFVLLGKILLTARVYHYGFALAMPATLLLVACVLHFIPKTLRELYGDGGVFRRFALAMLIADAFFFLKISNGYYDAKTIHLGAGDDVIVAMKTDPRGPVVQRTLSRLRTLMPVEATMMVLPEGVMLNYLSRRTNPTPFTNFMPPEVAIFGEAKMLAALKEHPPDFILIAPKDAAEYGVGSFGTDPNYGMQIMRWVYGNYSIVEEVDAESSDVFSIKIMKLGAPGSAAN